MSIMPIIMIGIGAGLLLALKSNKPARIIPLDTMNLELVIRFFKRPYIRNAHMTFLEKALRVY